MVGDMTTVFPSVDNTYKPYRIGFLLINEFSMLAFASALEPLRAANMQAGQKLFEWTIASATGISVTASNGTVVNAEFDLKILDQCHMVLVCSGVRARENCNKDILNLIRRLDRQGTTIGAICTGTYIMAAAGLLDGKRCTIHWENIDGLSGRISRP